MSSKAHPVAAGLLRALAPQVLGAVARRHGDFASAEDAVQEALMAAASQWPLSGLPDNPHGWLYQVAMRRLADQARSERSRERREALVARERFASSSARADTDVEEDDTLLVIFMCCHPSLSSASAIALTLRAVGGLSSAEIASAFLVPEATMAQRISRAKQSIRTSGIGFVMPSHEELANRRDAVLRVLYLIFNEGYTTSSGAALQRTDLSNEAIRLARMLRVLLPSDGEVAGLLSLMLSTDARRAARSGQFGELIPLDEQDRSLWDRQLIAEGVALVSASLSTSAVGGYQLQAAIAAVHDEAPSAGETDWTQILMLYEVLDRMSDNPMVTLNKAIAVAMVNGAPAALQLIDAIADDTRLRGHYRVDAVRAHLLQISGDVASALELYRAAALKTASIPERDYLNVKAARLAASST